MRQALPVEKTVTDHERTTMALLSLDKARPFDSAPALTSMYVLARALYSRLIAYDLVVADDTSARIPSQVYWRLINQMRSEHQLPKAKLMFYDGRNSQPQPPGTFPAPTTAYSRALVLTEVASSGGCARQVYDAALPSRSNALIDIAAIVSGAKSHDLLDKISGAYYAGPYDGATDVHLYSHLNLLYKGVAKGFQPAAVTRLRAGHFDATKVAAARGSAIEVAQTFGELLARPQT